MSIEFVTGDLFANRVNASAFAHGCNCAGSMGTGIAVGFKEPYPTMFEEFRRRCKAKPTEFGLGEVFLWREEGRPAVFNLGTQPRPGRGATYPVVAAAPEGASDRSGRGRDPFRGNATNRRRIRRTVVEEGAFVDRSRIHELVGDAVRLRGVPSGRVRTTVSDEHALLVATRAHPNEDALCVARQSFCAIRASLVQRK